MDYYESVGTDAEHKSCLLASGYWVFGSIDRCGARSIS